jgi:predicted nuclease of predicted toxin-antitoxin system
MAAKLYMDEQTSYAIIAGLRQHGIDVLTTPEAGMMGAADPDHLALATRLGRVLYTEDKDFLILHTRGITHAGIAYARRGMTIGEIIETLTVLCGAMEPPEMVNHLQYLSELRGS